MTRTEKAAIVYGVSVLGAAAVSYLRGKRDAVDICMDAAIHGGLVGTGANVVWWLYDEHKQTLTPVLAVTNNGQEKCNDCGKVSSDGVSLLSQINPDILYKAAKLGSIAIGLAPEDPNVVVLPEG